MNRPATLLVLALAALMFPSCSQFADFLLGYDSGQQSTRPFIADANAERMALYYSRERTAPLDLYQTIAYDWRAIEAMEMPDSSEIVMPPFRPPWAAGSLLIWADSATGAAMQQGLYTAWNRLNATIGVTEIRYWDWRLRTDQALSVTFDERLNVARVAEAYEELPGVSGTEPNHWFGDYPNTFLRLEPGRRVYFFRDAWGDCPAGCGVEEWWVVEVSGRGPRLLCHPLDTGAEWATEFRSVKQEWQTYYD